jgi:lipoate-protein ligase A
VNGQSCEQWRLLYDEPMEGAANMARDEALLRAVGARLAPPTLRLYAWRPPTVSLGYGQRIADIDEARLAAHGWGLVRRLTGGRAILHTDELTYSVTLPADHTLAQGNVIDSYRRISLALQQAAQRMGIAPEARPAAAPGTVSPVCFETPSHYELTVFGRKLVGSAQARRHGGLLQHGSLPLQGDLARITEALVFPDEAARNEAASGVRTRAITLSEAAGRSVSFADAADAFMEAVRVTFGVALVRGMLSDAETATEARLAREVYGNRAWTVRR